MIAIVCVGSGALACASEEVLRSRREKRAEVRRAVEERRSVDDFGAIRHGALQRREAILFEKSVSEF